MYQEKQFLMFLWISLIVFLAPGLIAYAGVWWEDPHPTLRRWLHLKPQGSH